MTRHIHNFARLVRDTARRVGGLQRPDTRQARRQARTQRRQDRADRRHDRQEQR